MIFVDKKISELMQAPIRNINATVDLNGSAVATYKADDALQDFVINQAGAKNKITGYLVSRELKINIIDKYSKPIPQLGDTLDITMFVKDGETLLPFKAFPLFYVSSVEYDENKHLYSITAYDKIEEFKKFKFSDIKSKSYNISEFINEVCGLAGLTPLFSNIYLPLLDYTYPEGANYNPDFSLRDIVDDIAEFLGAIAYIDVNGNIVFRVPQKEALPVWTVNKDNYYTLEVDNSARVVTKLVATNELGDNVFIGDDTGNAMYLRSNGLIDNRNDIQLVLRDIMESVRGLMAVPHKAKWRSCCLLEPGDKIRYISDKNSCLCFYGDTSITYNGGLKEQSQWGYDKEVEEHATPVTVGEALTQTTAKVDKINKRITLEVTEANKRLTQLELNTEGISADVQSIESQQQSNTGAIEQITKKVNATMTPEEIKFTIDKQLANGVNKVTTSRGFTFNDEGMQISKSDSEISTLITEDGMRISQSGTDVLTANNQGVDARNLRATTYLIIGGNSRFEDYQGNRTACFFIG